MLDPKKIAELDQAQKMIVETYPPLLGGLHKGFIETGFNEEQAFELILVYMECTLNANINE